MNVAESLEAFTTWRETGGGRLGLVPTMGALHDGHLSLVRRARRETDRVVTTIFVNPTQFGSSDDLKAYPRDLDRDLALLREERVDCVFTPGEAMMYPGDFSTEPRALDGRAPRRPPLPRPPRAARDRPGRDDDLREPDAVRLLRRPEGLSARPRP